MPGQTWLGFFENKEEVRVNTQLIFNEDSAAEIYIDVFNKRLRVDDIRGNIDKAIEKAEELVQAYQAEKLIVKGRQEQYEKLVEHGFQCEAVIDGYFLGSNLVFFCKYYTIKRRTSQQWIQEDQIIKQVLALEGQKQTTPPAEYQIKKCSYDDADALALLYGNVFQIYPTPLYDPQYIRRTLDEGTIYYSFQTNGVIVSAASAEVNSFYKNAELTDCATLPEHRKHGLMKILLEKLEEELKMANIYCAYSIARSLSFGMNAALHQLSYSYRGRLMNNCYIFDKLEDMNVWVKDLSKG